MEWTPEKMQAIADAFTVPLGKCLSEPPPPRDYFVPKLLPEHGIVTIVGEPGSGKSWLAYDLIRAAVQDPPWLWRTAGTKKTRALLLNFDNPTDLVIERFSQLGLDGSVGNKVLIHTPEYIKPPASLLRLPESAEAIAAIVECMDVGLVVIDSFRQAHTGDEQSSQEMGKMMACLRDISVPQPHKKSLVVIVHHTVKGEGNNWASRARGSGEIVSSSDLVIEIEKQHLVWTKIRSWSLGERPSLKFSIRGDENHVAVRAEGKPPGVSDDDENLRAVMAVLAMEQRALGMQEIADATHIPVKSLPRIVDLGVVKGLLTEPKRVDNYSQKRFVSLANGTSKVDPG